MISAASDYVLDLLKRANRLGARNIEVIGYISPRFAGDNPEGVFVVRIPEGSDPCNRAWYDK